MVKLADITAEIGADTSGLERALIRSRSLTDEFANRIDGARGSTANFGRTMLEVGRISQDFAQGGIGGILNNVEGLTMALGLGTGLAGVLTAVGVAAVFVAPKIYDFAKSLVLSKTEVPPLSDAVAALTEKQKANAKAIDDLRAKGSLYAGEMKELTRLLGEQAEVEARLTQLKERRGFEKEFGPGKSPLEMERGKAFQEMLKAQGGLGPIRDLITGAVTAGASSQENLETLTEYVAEQFDEAIKGNAEAIQRIVEMSRNTFLTPLQKAVVAATSPAELSKSHVREIDANMAKVSAEFRKRKEEETKEVEKREKMFGKPFGGSLSDRVKEIFKRPFDMMRGEHVTPKSITGLTGLTISEFIQEQMRNVARIDYLAKHPKEKEREVKSATMMSVEEYSRAAILGVLNKPEDKEWKDNIRETKEILSDMGNNIREAITQMRGRAIRGLFPR